MLFQDGRERKDVAHIVVHHQVTFLPTSRESVRRTVPRVSLCDSEDLSPPDAGKERSPPANTPVNPHTGLRCAVPVFLIWEFTSAPGVTGPHIMIGGFAPPSSSGFPPPTASREYRQVSCQSRCRPGTCAGRTRAPRRPIPPKQLRRPCPPSSSTQCARRESDSATIRSFPVRRSREL